MKVRKEADGKNSTHDDYQLVEMTDGLCKAVALYNGNMTAEEVKQAWLAGKTVYTNFNRYVPVPL